VTITGSTGFMGRAIVPIFLGGDGVTRRPVSIKPSRIAFHIVALHHHAPILKHPNREETLRTNVDALPG
jgi:hypothetical protein